MIKMIQMNNKKQNKFKMKKNKIIVINLLN